MLAAVLDTHLNDFHLELSLSAPTGKTTVLLGESGAGKSSVLRLLAGLLHPQRGHISLCTIRLHNGEHAIEVMAAWEEHIQLTRLPGIGEEAFVVVDPRSITLYQAVPDSSARNIFHGEIVQVLRLGSATTNAGRNDGRVRISIMLDASMPPLTAEITETSAARMELSEGKRIYATFKATEARAYT